MNQEHKSDSEVVSAFLTSLTEHSSYEPVFDLPIPAQNGLIVKHLPKSNIIETDISLGGDDDSKLILSTGNNTQDTCEGIIMMVGPKCSPDPRVGLKIQFSSQTMQQGTKFRHKGKEYIAMDEYAILFYVPDESTIVDNGVKDPRQLRREKKTELQKQTFKNVYEHEQKELDIKNDKTKGKTRKLN